MKLSQMSIKIDNNAEIFMIDLSQADKDSFPQAHDSFDIRDIVEVTQGEDAVHFVAFDFIAERLHNLLIITTQAELEYIRKRIKEIEDTTGFVFEH